MTETGMPEMTPQIECVGPDRVTISEEQVTIEARRPMPEWKVRELNPAPIYFKDGKYYLVEQRPGEGRYAVRYVLRPWPEGQSTATKLFHTYDAEAVAERDGASRGESFDNLVHAFLCPFYPFLGLLWSGPQKWLCRIGFVPRTISGLSIYTIFGLLLSQGIFAVITIQATVRSGKMMVGGLLSAFSHDGALHLGSLGIPLGWVDLALTLAFLADVAVRYSRYLRDDDWSGGFLEWIVRREPEDQQSARRGVQATPPPLPSAGQAPGSGWERQRLLVRLSYWLPAAVLGVCLVIYGGLHDTGSTIGGPVLALCGRVLGAALLAGLGLSIAALFGVRRYGRRGLLWPGLWGLLLNSAILAVFLSGVARGWRNGQLLVRARETTRQISADLRRDLTNSNLEASLESGEARVDKMRGALDDVSRNSSGDTALAARVSSEHLGKMRALMTVYEKAYKGLDNPPWFDMSGVTNRQQLFARKERVKNFLAANDRLQAFVRTSSENYERDLRAAGVSASQVAATMAGYEKSSSAQIPLVMKVRDDDRSLGNAMLGMLDVLDQQWGKWSYNTARQKVDFDNPAALDKYIDYREAMQAAARDQRKQQTRIAGLIK